jgi:hypothetical protein
MKNYPRPYHSVFSSHAGKRGELFKKLKCDFADLILDSDRLEVLRCRQECGMLRPNETRELVMLEKLEAWRSGKDFPS